MTGILFSSDLPPMKTATRMKENIDFYKNLLDNLYDGVYTLNADRMITYWNKGAERLTGYSAEDVIGRRCSDDILAHMDDQGRNLCELACAVQEAIISGQTCENEVYLRHKQGHRVPVLVRVTPITGMDGQVVGALQVFSDNFSKIELKKQVEDLQKQSLLDPLTRLANRRAMEVFLESRREEFQRFKWPFGILFIDIDRFKQINDRFGHVVGDDVLKMVSRTLARIKRPFDIVGRWGGEEFVALIANVDNRELSAIAERYRMFVYKSKIKLATNEIRVSVSIGATLCRRKDTTLTLVDRADALMYRCKRDGGNCVRMEK